jgi:threonine efflux protein
MQSPSLWTLSINASGRGTLMQPAIDVSVLTTFTLLWAAIVPVPGANSLMVTHVALTRGRVALVYAIAGNMLGIMLLALCALLGMAILLEAFSWLRLAIHLLGGAYLVYFGARLIDRSRRSEPAPTIGPDEAAGRSTWRTLGLGFATALSNAQAIVFITSIFAVGGVLTSSIATGLACICVIIVLNATYLGLLGWLFLRPTPRKVYARFRRVIEGTIGTLFVVLGIRLLVRELARG